MVRYYGRKTGIEISCPVGYAAAGDELTPDPRTVRPPISSVIGQGVKGESAEGARLARIYFLRYPGRARARGLKFTRTNAPDLEAIRPAAGGLTFVDVSLPKES